MGTGNDWNKTHQISSDYKEAINQIIEGKTIIQDVGKIIYKNKEIEETRYFINSVGIGFDARVVKYAMGNKIKGKSKKSDYLKGLIHSLIAHKNVKGLIKLDEKELETKI